MTTEYDLTVYASKDDAVQALVDAGMKVKEATDYVKAHGDFSKKVNAMDTLVAIFMEGYGVTDKKALIAKAAAETGYSPSTVNHFYNAIPFAKEWSVQSK